jgi:hypothetical protein
MEGFTVVATRPDGSVTKYGVSDGVPFATREAAEAVARDPAVHLEADWASSVQPWEGEELVGLPE